MDSTMKMNDAKGFYKLSWLQRIGFGSGDLAQNLNLSDRMYLLIFYTNVYGLKPEVAAVMFLIVRIVDIIWDPLVGAFVDKHNPKLGKYRSYLILGGIPLTDIFYKAGMALGGVVPGLVMAFVGFDQTNEVPQSPFAEQGILWLVAVIPALLLLVAMFIISKYGLEDDVIDNINREIELRHKGANK